MAFDTDKYHRRSIRLKGYDYRHPGAYFVTICTQDRACLFGDVLTGEMRFNEAGRMVIAEWERISERFPNVELDTFVVMPNHIHSIIMITEPVGAGLVPARDGDIAGAGLVPAHDGDIAGAGLVPAHNGATTENGATTRVAPTVGNIVGAFKSITTVRYIQGVKQYGWPPFRVRLWQRNYYEHIIRNEESLHRIGEYIAANPLRWHLDRENPLRVGEDDLWEKLFTKDVAHE